MNKKTTLHYSHEQDQWYVKLSGRTYPMHCGESFLLHIGKTPVSCRLELDTNWYVILQEIAFILHPSAVYTVSI